MGDWSSIELDMMVMIAEKLEFYEDFKAFGCVCAWWKRAMKLAREPSASRQTPLLMVTEPPQSSKHYQFYGLNERVALEIELPVPSTTRGGDDPHYDNMDLRLLFRVDEDEQSKWRYFSSRGWLICVTQNGLNIILIHPVSGLVIQPPAIPENIMRRYHALWDDTLYVAMFNKLALSENPATTSDYTMVMIFPTYRSLAFWRNGDKEWTMINYQGAFLDVTFYNGEFYAIEQTGKLLALGKSASPTPRMVVDLHLQLYCPNTLYLVESASKLLLVSRKVRRNETEDFYTTFYFEVWELNVNNGEAKEITHLGNRALFLGCNSSFSMEAFPSQCCKPNCIYYTDDIEGNRWTCDMGVFDIVAGQKVQGLYDDPQYISSYPCPSPLWVESPFSSASMYVK